MVKFSGIRKTSEASHTIKHGVFDDKCFIVLVLIEKGAVKV